MSKSTHKHSFKAWGRLKAVTAGWERGRRRWKDISCGFWGGALVLQSGIITGLTSWFLLWHMVSFSTLMLGV